MAKSKNHTGHNENRKNHRNGIKKAKVFRERSTKGMYQKFKRNHKYVVKYTLLASKLTDREIKGQNRKKREKFEKRHAAKVAKEGKKVEAKKPEEKKPVSKPAPKPDAPKVERVRKHKKSNKVIKEKLHKVKTLIVKRNRKHHPRAGLVEKYREALEANRAKRLAAKKNPKAGDKKKAPVKGAAPAKAAAPAKGAAPAKAPAKAAAKKA